MDRIVRTRHRASRVLFVGRIAAVAGALLAGELGLGRATLAQQGGGAPPGQRGPASRVDAEGMPEELKPKFIAYATEAQKILGGEGFGLRLPDVSRLVIRIRLPRPNDPIVPGPQIYTAGKQALTLYARNSNDVMNGAADFDPIFSVLDGTSEAAWGTHVRSAFWLIPSAVRNGLDRHFSQQVLAVLEKAAEKNPEAPRWPGAAKPRKGSLGTLPANHPLIEDRDHVVDLLDRFTAEPRGRDELIRVLNTCGDRLESGPRVLTALTTMLAPLLGDGTKPLLPPSEFATREPWPGPGPKPLAVRMAGLAGEPSLEAQKIRLTFGEQRATPTEFEDWGRGGAPTLLFHSPLSGIWSLATIDLCARRTVGEKDDAANRMFYAVALDEQFHELTRWPFAQASLPVGKAGWVKLMINASPELPNDFWFIALETDDPGPGAKLEICVRPDAAGEHCFRSVPGRKVSALAAPVDYAVYVGISGQAVRFNATPIDLFAELKKWCAPK